MITQLLKAAFGIFEEDPYAEKKGWVEYSVDTYWTRHMIIAGRSLNHMHALFVRDHRGVTCDCIGIYTGPKEPGEVPDRSDVPFMEGYRGNPGRVFYFNGAKPVDA